MKHYMVKVGPQWAHKHVMMLRCMNVIDFVEEFDFGVALACIVSMRINLLQKDVKSGT